MVVYARIIGRKVMVTVMVAVMAAVIGCGGRVKSVIRRVSK